MMKRFLLLTLLLSTLLACVTTTTTPAIPTPNSYPEKIPMSLPTYQPEPTETSPVSFALQRGVNIGHMFEIANEEELDIYFKEEYFDLIKDAGFDFVRLPVNWKAHTTRTGYDDGDTGYTIEPAFFDRVDEVIGWALSRNLVIIIDFHNYDSLMSEPNGEQFWFLWEQISEHYKDYPPQVLFELLSEPNDKITAPLWNVYVHIALEIIRENNPTRDVIFGPVNWNSYFWVNTLDVPNDPHIIVTFHYSDPFYTTYRNTEGPAWFGDIWPNNEERKREVTRDFNHVADWAQRHDVRILLGEFGVYNETDMDSLVRWTEFVRSEAERHGFAWAYWDFASGFGVYDPVAKLWREDLLKALIP